MKLTVFLGHLIMPDYVEEFQFNANRADCGEVSFSCELQTTQLWGEREIQLERVRRNLHKSQIGYQTNISQQSGLHWLRTVTLFSSCPEERKILFIAGKLIRTKNSLSSRFLKLSSSIFMLRVEKNIKKYLNVCRNLNSSHVSWHRHRCNPILLKCLNNRYFPQN